MKKPVELGVCPICHGQLLTNVEYEHSGSYDVYFGIVGCPRCSYVLHGPCRLSSEKARAAVYDKWILLTGKVIKEYARSQISPDKKAVKACRQRRASEIMSNPDDARHGRHTTYDLGCRCELCRKAESVYRQDLKRRKEERLVTEVEQ